MKPTSRAMTQIVGVVVVVAVVEDTKPVSIMVKPCHLERIHYYCWRWSTLTIPSCYGDTGFHCDDVMMDIAQKM